MGRRSSGTKVTQPPYGFSIHGYPVLALGVHKESAVATTDICPTLARRWKPFRLRHISRVIGGRVEYIV